MYKKKNEEEDLKRHLRLCGYINNKTQGLNENEQRKTSVPNSVDNTRTNRTTTKIRKRKWEKITVWIF